MKKVIALAALAVIAMAPAFAKAEDTMMKKETMTKTEMSAPMSDSKEMTMKDGTKVMVEGDKVYTMSDDGTKTPAKDGTWEMADGSKVMTKDGMMVKEKMMKK